MAWTPERVKKLERLWADGRSASQIAEHLGGATRNAVIGKIHRLGLSGREQNTSVRNTNYAQRRAQRFRESVARLFGDGHSDVEIAAMTRRAVSTVRNTRRAQGLCRGKNEERVQQECDEAVFCRQKRAGALADLTDKYVFPAFRKAIGDLERHDCRWPLGSIEGGDLHFCGDRCADGLSYCQKHAVRAYRPKLPRSQESVKIKRLSAEMSGVRRPEIRHADRRVA